MKSCAYCGRESADEAAHCLGCGTEFVAEPEDAKPPQPRDWTWIKAACDYVGGVFLIFLLYLLSFGPVTRYSATVISRSSTPTATGFTSQQTVQYPRWVGVVYYPVLLLVVKGRDGGLADLYRHYLQWWE